MWFLHEISQKTKPKWTSLFFAISRISKNILLGFKLEHFWLKDESSFILFKIPNDISSIILLEYDKQAKKVLTRGKSVAFLRALQFINFPWSCLGKVLSYVPLIISNSCYDFVAHNRYRLFGKVPITKLFLK